MYGRRNVASGQNTASQTNASSIAKLPTISHRNSEETIKQEGGEEGENDSPKQIPILKEDASLQADKEPMIIVDEEQDLQNNKEKML